MTHPLHHPAEIHLVTAHDIDPELIGVPDISCCPGRPDEALGGHTSHIEAITSHEVILHKGHPGSQTGGACSGYQACRAGPDNHQVVAGCRFRVNPVDGVNIVFEDAVLAVEIWKVIYGISERMIHGDTQQAWRCALGQSNEDTQIPAK